MPYAYLLLLRPQQWVKNAFVFAPLLFAFRFDDVEAWQAAVIAFLAFIAASGAVYIFNDLRDIEHDKLHPRKRFRPLASGAVTPLSAALLGVALTGGAFAAATLLPLPATGILALYFLLNLAYSLELKKFAVLDVIIVSSGYVLRVLMGGFAVGVAVSSWLILTTFMLALFIAFCKRRAELEAMGDKPTRNSLKGYNLPFLDKLINLSCASTLITYAIYAVQTSQEIGKLSFLFTVAFVVYGLFRYLQNIYVFKHGESPESLVYRDPVFLVNLVLWGATTLGIMML